MHQDSPPAQKDQNLSIRLHAELYGCNGNGGVTTFSGRKVHRYSPCLTLQSPKTLASNMRLSLSLDARESDR